MSHQDQDAEIGRLIREHGDRRRLYLALSAKLNRIGASLGKASDKLSKAELNEYNDDSYHVKVMLQDLSNEVDMRGLLMLVEEHIHIGQQLKREQETLAQFGVDFVR